MDYIDAYLNDGTMSLQTIIEISTIEISVNMCIRRIYLSKLKLKFVFLFNF